MKKKFLLLYMLLVIPVFASQILVDLAEPVSNIEGLDVAEVMPIEFRRSPGETLKYDNDVWTNGVGIYSQTTPMDPYDWQQYGFATYFELHEFGINGPRKISTILLQFFNIYSATDFRLFVWNNVSYGILRPESHYIVHPCSILGAPLPPVMTWGAFDVSSYDIILPDTFWIGVCYNEITTGNASWYLAIDETVSDDHTYINLQGGPSGWEIESQFPNAFAVRAVVDMLAVDVGPSSIDIPASVPPSTTLSPMATVRNNGTENAASFDVTCEIEPGGYSTTENISSLASGDSVQVIFSPDFTFETGIYTVTVYTDLSGDEYPDNDTLIVDINATGIAEDGTDVLTPYGFWATTISKGNAHIQFTLPSATMVDLAVYDALGRLRTTVISKRLSAGYHSIDTQFDLPAGVYFYNMKTGLGEQVMEKFLLMR